MPGERRPVPGQGHRPEGADSPQDWARFIPMLGRLIGAAASLLALAIGAAWIAFRPVPGGWLLTAAATFALPTEPSRACLQRFSKKESPCSP